jgi:hypothetical protein
MADPIKRILVNPFGVHIELSGDAAMHARCDEIRYGVQRACEEAIPRLMGALRDFRESSVVCEITDSEKKSERQSSQGDSLQTLKGTMAKRQSPDVPKRRSSTPKGSKKK